jgi:hypothetical protein
MAAASSDPPGAKLFDEIDATDCICSGLLTVAPPATLTHGGESSLCNQELEGNPMAKRKRKYSPSAGRDVESEMRRFKRGTAKSGKGGKGGKVKSREQAIAIGLSKARKEGKRVPKKK